MPMVYRVRWIDVGPPSTTLAQHQPNTVPTSNIAGME